MGSVCFRRRALIAYSLIKYMSPIRNLQNSVLMFDSGKRLRKDVRQLIVRIGVDDFDNLLRERIAYSVVPNVDVFGALVDSLRLNQGPGALIIDM